MTKPKANLNKKHGLAIKQERSKVTYDALVTTGFKMLEKRDLQDISIAELSQEAGYSVGAFYARFRSKDEFFDAMISEHLDIRTQAQKEMFASLPKESLIDELVHNIVHYYWEHRKFWRAVIARSVRDPESWAPMRKHRLESTARFIETVAILAQRELSQKEIANISFAFQVTLGTVDSTVINEPGPLFLGQDIFIRELTRTFSLVSEFSSILGSSLS